VSRAKDTNKKEEIKEEVKIAKSITSKAELKNVEVVNKVLEQKAEVRTPGSLPSTYTKIQLRNGTIKETYGERYGKPISS
tara:strand:- start:14372 stop:14611 length:240 start_codon:yes stop_codon:yes gene_type:complete